MSNEQITAITVPEKLDGITKAQEAQVSRLGKLCGELARLACTMDARLSALESVLGTSLTITYAQSLALDKVIRARALELCRGHNLPVQPGAKLLRAAMRRELCSQYGIRNRADLPAVLYNGAMHDMGTWTSYEAVKRIRGKLGYPT